MTVIAYNDVRELPAGIVLIAGVNAAGQAQVFQVDGSGNLDVTGGGSGGGTSSTVTLANQGTGTLVGTFALSTGSTVTALPSGTQAVSPPSPGLGTDASSNKPATLASSLATGTVLNPGALYVQNQSAATVQLWLGAAPGAAGATPILIAPGAGANAQGGDWQAASNAPWFTGTYTVLGASGAQVAVRSN